MNKPMTYAGSGVAYDAMDQFKRMAQLAGRETATNISRLNNGEFREAEIDRGESTYLIEVEAAKSYFAHVEEGLGTKNLVADALYRLTGKSYYDHIAQDTVAMIVNDMITAGALPLSVAMHLAVGDSSWFDDKQRCRDLIEGWKNACLLARCVWGGGETSTLNDIVAPEAIVISGSAIGLVKPKERLIAAVNIQHGDAIMFIQSSGIHANGLTMARKIAEKLPNGYLTQLANGRSYGATLLDPTPIYVALVEECLNRCINIHYAVNITGHGWRKLMRAVEPFVYVVEDAGESPPLFQFMQEHGLVSDEEAFATFNMGAGFALYVPPDQATRVIELAAGFQIKAWLAGYIEKRGEEKKVIIVPKDIEYAAETLAIR